MSCELPASGREPEAEAHWPIARSPYRAARSPQLSWPTAKTMV
jgi:hypothetical protein